MSANAVPAIESVASASAGRRRPLSSAATALTFDSMEAMQEALASPEGQATIADMADYASGGATVTISEVL